MYPNLYYLFQDFFGVEWNFLKLINTFGFCVAMAFIASAWVLTQELKRKQVQGLFSFTEQKILIGTPATAGDLATNFILGFILGFKIVGAFTIPDALNDPQSFILSAQGNPLMGIILGLGFMGLKWWEKNRQKLAKPQEHTIRVWPHDRVGDVVIYAAIFGFLGAKIFHNLENWDDFVKDPVGALISFSGLTFYGGLICAAIAIYYYARKHNIPFIHLCDAMAPTLMLAYAIGRVGCHMAGDGDWGILNSAFISDAQGHLVAATTDQFNAALHANQDFFSKQFATFESIQYQHVEPFLGLPKWLFAYNYPHNVINEGVAFSGCTGAFCHYLPVGVFPTAFYETVMCSILFLILWRMRKKFTIPGQLFAIYLIMNGVERFFIEKIRVNTKYHWGFMHPTQAELISTLLVIGGIIFYFYSKKKVKAV
ncbi:MAG: prolipoprotein diacylglyceryl transferase [Bacteroidota bacterium]|nr:prolipoprotein diacylglyceryl transferase [Bacteroidota bacterium]